MRFVTYRSDRTTRVGVLGDDEVVTPLDAPDLLTVIAGWPASRPATSPTGSAGTPFDTVDLVAPIPRPSRNVFCVGKNYREHAREFAASGYDRSGAGPDEPSTPVVFTKPPSSVIGPEATIERHPALTDALDYEAELAVIIGAGGRDISVEDAPGHVWGYTIINDVTARDRQRDHKQWFLGKGLDTFCPMGPMAVTAEEIDPAGDARPDLEVSCRVNGELRQKASTRDLIFDIPTLIASISAGLTPQPGDIIATGTPAGVGIGFDPSRFLQTGDEIEVTITGLGTLSNSVG